MPVIDILPSVVSSAAPEKIFIPSLLVSVAFPPLPSRVILPIPKAEIREPAPSTDMPSLLCCPELPVPVRVMLPVPVDSIVPFLTKMPRFLEREPPPVPVIAIEPLSVRTEAESISTPSFTLFPEPAIPVIDIAPVSVSKAVAEDNFTPSLLLLLLLPEVPVREILPFPALMVLLLIAIPVLEPPNPVAVAVKLPPFVAIAALVMLIPPMASRTTLSLSLLEVILAPLLILIFRSACRVRVASPPPVLAIASLAVISPLPPEPPAVVIVTSVPLLRDVSIVAGVTSPLAEIVISLGSSSHCPPWPRAAEASTTASLPTSNLIFPEVSTNPPSPPSTPPRVKILPLKTVFLSAQTTTEPPSPLVVASALMMVSFPTKV